MKPITNHYFTLAMALALAFGLLGLAVPAAAAPANPTVPAQQGPSDKVVLGDNYSLDEGETLDGSLVVLGGNASLAEDSQVTGDVVILGGNLQGDGEIGGDVTVVGGQVALGDQAVVMGDVNTVGSNLSRAEGARIEGDVNTDVRIPFLFSAPATLREWDGNLPVTPQIPTPQAVDMGVSLVGKFLWWLGRSLIWALLALLAMLFIPRHTERIASAAMTEPLPSGGLGLLTAIVAPLLLGLIALTICGIPITLVGMLLLALAWALGMIALGLETGARLERLVHMDWAPSVQAAIGAFFLTLVTNGIGWLIPCVGWLIPFMVGLVGFGAALLTRFGAQSYPPAAGAGVVNAPAPAPYSPPPAQPPVTQVYDAADNVADNVASDDLPPAS